MKTRSMSEYKQKERAQNVLSQSREPNTLDQTEGLRLMRQLFMLRKGLF